MRIATFNVESLDLPVAPRASVLRPALERLRADILCLQEINGQRIAGQSGRSLEALERLIDGMAYAGYHRAASGGGHGGGVADVHNLVTLSRFRITASRRIHHDLLPPVACGLVTADPRGEASPIRFERPMLVTEHEIGQATLTVINAHLRAPLASVVPGQKLAPFAWRSVGGWAEGYYVSALKRSGQALELRLLIDQLFDRDPEALIVTAGDFNAEDHETPVRIVAGAPEDTGNPLLSGRAMVVLDRGIEQSRRFSVLHHGRPQMVDHLLSSHRLFGHLRGVEVHNEALGDEAMGYSRGIEPAGSWHAPVVAEFDLDVPQVAGVEGATASTG